MASIQQIQVGSNTFTLTHPFITCTTAAATSAKAISFTGLDAVKGTQVNIKFTNGNTAPTPTLSLNGGTAKSIVGYGLTAPATFSSAGSIMHVVCDGTQWNILG